MAQNVRFKKHAIKLFQYSSIVFDLHNKELSDGLSATQQLVYKLDFLQLS